MTLPLAHPGHWLAELLYVAPVLALVGWISVRALLDRRRERREQAERDADQEARSSSAMS